MNRYTELYCWIRYSFNDEPFGIDDFRSVFPTSQAPKVIHDLVQYGYLTRVNRGIYRTVKPEQLVEDMVRRSSNREILRDAKRKYAYCDSTAVAIWTQGYYWTGFTKGFKPCHIKVLTRDRPYWERFFAEHRAPCAFHDESRTLFGFVYILHPDRAFAAIDRAGDKVIPLKEVVSFCLEREISYQPALEYLDELYGIGYAKREYVVA